MPEKDDELTTIQVTRGTLKKIISHKLCDDETYESVLKRLLDGEI